MRLHMRLQDTVLSRHACACNGLAVPPAVTFALFLAILDAQGPIRQPPQGYGAIGSQGYGAIGSQGHGPFTQTGPAGMTGSQGLGPGLSLGLSQDSFIHMDDFRSQPGDHQGMTQDGVGLAHTWRLLLPPRFSWLPHH